VSKDERDKDTLLARKEVEIEKAAELLVKERLRHTDELKQVLVAERRRHEEEKAQLVAQHAQELLLPLPLPLPLPLFTRRAGLLSFFFFFGTALPAPRFDLPQGIVLATVSFFAFSVDQSSVCPLPLLLHVERC
jgi:hypothetical protein